MHDPPFLCAFFDTVGLACEGLAVIRTSAPRLRFIASTGLNAELHQAVGWSPVLRGSGDFYLLLMDQAEIDNWKAIAGSMEAKGSIESWFYLRARAIADGKPEPMPNVSELMGGSAA